MLCMISRSIVVDYKGEMYFAPRDAAPLDCSHNKPRLLTSALKVDLRSPPFGYMQPDFVINISIYIIKQY